MKNKAWIAIGLIVLLSAAATLAEDTSVPKPASLKLPKGKEAWTVQIHRTGGIIGVVRDMTISSDGKVQCEPAEVRCMPGLNSQELKTWTDLVFKASVPDSEYLITGSCSDCYLTAITVRRLNAKGKGQTLFAYWDDPYSGKPPAELVKIAHAADSLGR